MNNIEIGSNIKQYRIKKDLTQKQLAEFITDAKIIVGSVITILGVVVWVAISWTSLLERVGAVEDLQGGESGIRKEIFDQLGELKEQQTIIQGKVDAIDKKTDETNNIVHELLKLIK